MRYNRRRRINNMYREQNTYRDIDGSYTNVPYEEFKFYNVEKNIIDNVILEDIYQKVINKDEIIFWTNKDFGDKGILFRFRKQAEKRITTQEDNTNNVSVKTEIESNEISFNTFVDIMEFGFPVPEEMVSKIKDVVHKIFFTSFKLDLDTKEMLNKFSWDSISINEAVIFDSRDEMINYFIEKKFASSYSVDRYSLSQRDFAKDMKYLFDYKIDRTITPEIIQEEYSSDDVEVYYIFDVIEKRINNRNYRIALMSESGRYSTSYAIKVFDEDHVSYNYIDKNRVFFKDTRGDGRPIFLDLPTNRYNNDGQIEISRDTISHIKKDLTQILAPTERLITPLLYNFYYERYGQKRVKFKTNEMFERLKEQYEKLLMAGKEIKINDIIIHKNYIRLGDEFNLEFEEGFIDVVQHLNDIRGTVNIDNAQYNLNTIYEGLLGLSKIGIIRAGYVRDDEYKRIGSVSFKLNGMPITVRRGEDKRIKINEIFCRIEDTYSILCRAICYTTIREYERFLKDVSYIGVEWKKLINNGIMIELVNPFYGIFRKTGKMSYEKILLRFSLLWDDKRRTQVYLLANRTKYLIRYKGKFKRHLGTPNVVMSMENLKMILTDCLGEFDKEVFLGLVQNAIKEAEIVRQRGEELVAYTIKDTKAIETTIEINNKEIQGYKIVGIRTSTPYFINRITLEVYKFTDGNWNRRCVVDDPNKQRIFEDRLANRLVNIYNEYRGISTIQN